MSEFDLNKLAAIDETVSHFFFPALALNQRRVQQPHDDDDEEGAGYTTAEDEEPIRIPETILYSYSKPILWFYFDEATKRVMKRHGKYLNTSSILERFTENGQSRIGVRAWYVYPQEPEMITPQTSDFLCDIVSQDEVGHTGLQRFIQAPKGKGILQNYIDNKSESDGSMRNSYIHCDYSGSHFSTELYVSSKTLSLPLAAHDARKKPGAVSSSSSSSSSSPHTRIGSVSLALRFSPYSSVYERRPLVSSVMLSRLQKLCKSVAHRLHRLLRYTVSHMQLVCRIDHEDRLYVLWCSSMRLHAPLWPQSSFLLTPQGTLSEEYSLADRAKAAAHASSPTAQRSSRRSLVANSVSTNNDEAVARSIVHHLVSNIADDNRTKTPAGSSSALHLFASVGTTRVPGSSEPAQSGPTTLTSGGELVDTVHDFITCCVCRQPKQRGGLVKVSVQWVLFCLTPLNHAAQSWDTAHDVPPSVALVCPMLSKEQFDRIVASRDRQWLKTPVGVCVDCIEDLNKANEMMFSHRLIVPEWLGTDEEFVVGSRRSGAAAGRAAASSSSVKLVDLLTYFHHEHAEERSESSSLTRFKALISTKRSGTTSPADSLYRTKSALNSRRFMSPLMRRRSMQFTATAMEWANHPAITFGSAPNKDPEAGDLYRKDSRGVWRKIGFGKPTVNTRYVPPTPHVYSNSMLSASTNDFVASLKRVESLTDDDRLQVGWRRMTWPREEHIPDPPCHSPV